MKAHTSIQRTSSLEEIGLLHDAKKLFFVDLPITISVCFIDHLLQFLIGHALAQLLCDALEVLERDFASLVIIKQAESFENLILDRAAAIIIDIGNHLLNLFFLGFKAQGTHGYLKLLRIDGARTICVKKIEGFLDFLLLFLGQLLLLLATGIEATQSHV